MVIPRTPQAILTPTSVKKMLNHPLIRMGPIQSSQSIQESRLFHNTLEGTKLLSTLRLNYRLVLTAKETRRMRKDHKEKFLGAQWTL
jgi:hypothetical protein